MGDVEDDSVTLPIRRLPSDEIIRSVITEGLSRVAAVIDTNDDPHLSVAKTPKKTLRLLYKAKDQDQLRASATGYFTSVLQNAKQLTYRLPPVDFLFYGRTHNNIREFEFFLRKLDLPAYDAALMNAADLKFAGKTHSRNEWERLVELILPELLGFVRSRPLSVALIHQLADFAVHLNRYLLSLARHDSLPPLLAIVANDHSPNPVAFSQAMKAFQIPRLYLQHAEISKTFPPLDFEFSVLRSPRSLKTYCAIGPVKGDVFVISRRDDGDVRKPSAYTEDPVDVVIYPTGRLCVDGLARVVEKLRENRGVAGIHLKPHPNHKVDDWPANVSLRKSTPDFPHIALVANSSMVIELLREGIPVYQNFDLDPFKRDYYGFVAENIAPAVELDDLASPFWKSFDFDERWLRSYRSLYCLDADASHADVERLRAAIEGILAARTAPRVQDGRIVLHGHSAAEHRNNDATALGEAGRLLAKTASKLSQRLFLSWLRPAAIGLPKLSSISWPRPGAKAARTRKLDWLYDSVISVDSPTRWLGRTLDTGDVSDEDVIRVLDRVYIERHPVFFAIMDRLEDLDGHTSVFLWSALKRHEISGVALPYALDDMLADVFAVPGRGFVRSTVEGLAFGACLRHHRLDLLEKLLRRGKRIRLETLSTNRRLSLLQHYLKNGMSEEYRSLRDPFWLAGSPLHRLKIEDLEQRFGQRPGRTHGDMEQAFATSAPTAVGTEFKSVLKPIYDGLRTQMSFMDVHWSVEERANFHETVLNSIRHGMPFNMIRLSDGEGHAFADSHSRFSMEDQRNRERHWWGIELEPSVRQAIRESIQVAVQEADVLGIPSVYRFIRDTSDRSRSLAEKVQGRGLLQVLHYFSQTRNPTARFGDERMNLALFRSPEAMRELLRASRRCIIVSSADSDSLPRWMRDLTDVKSIAIPTHLRTSRNQKYHQSAAPLPLVYPAIDEELRNGTAPGTLVLVAAGIIGKVFIGTARRSGGVALDVGSVMDEWLGAGIHSLH